jgi:beta propeller repeat protein
MGAFLVLVWFFTTLSAHSVIVENSAVNWMEFSITSKNVLGLDVDQDIIVWDQSNYYSCVDQSINNYKVQQIAAAPFPFTICAHDIQTGEFFTVVNESKPDIYPRLNNDWLVYQRISTGISRLRARNLNTGEDIVIVDSPLINNNRNSNIHSEIVVFYDEREFEGDWANAIMAYDLTARILHTITISAAYSVGFPDVYDQTVVWQQAPIGTYDFDIMGYDLSTETPFTVSMQASSEQRPRIDGNIVVWEADGNIYGYDLTADDYLTITWASGTQASPSISEGLIVWTDDRNNQWDIYAYDLVDDQEYQITDNAIYESYPEVSGNLVAWIRQDEGIHAARKLSEFVFLPIIWR